MLGQELIHGSRFGEVKVPGGGREEALSAEGTGGRKMGRQHWRQGNR